MPDPREDEEEQGAWGRPVSARVGEWIMGAVLLGAACFFVWQSSYLPFGKIGLPGPAFFPFVLGLALAAFAVLLIAMVPRLVSESEVVFLGHRDVLIVLVALAGVAFAFERADSYLVLGVFAAVLLVVVGKTSYWRALLGAGFGMIAVWVIFRMALGVRLPAGDFWDVLGNLIATQPNGKG